VEIPLYIFDFCSYKIAYSRLPTIAIFPSYYALLVTMFSLASSLRAKTDHSRPASEVFADLRREI